SFTADVTAHLSTSSSISSVIATSSVWSHCSAIWSMKPGVTTRDEAPGLQPSRSSTSLAAWRRMMRASTADFSSFRSISRFIATGPPSSVHSDLDLDVAVRQRLLADDARALLPDLARVLLHPLHAVRLG